MTQQNTTAIIGRTGTAVGFALLGNMILPGFGGVVGSIVGSVVGAMLFPMKNKTEMPKLDQYPIQSSCKGLPVPKTYGTVKIAGNIIWMGEEHPYTVKQSSSGGKGGGDEQTTVETRYRRSFLIAICEGSASVIRAWKGKDEIDISDFTTYYGFNNTGISDVIGEDFAEYKNTMCVYFEEYNLGNSQAIPNFVFEVVNSLLVPLFTSSYGTYGEALDGNILNKKTSDSEDVTGWATDGHLTIGSGTSTATSLMFPTSDGGFLLNNEWTDGSVFSGKVAIGRGDSSHADGWIIGETVRGQTSGATARIVAYFNRFDNYVYWNLDSIVGVFSTTGEVLEGLSSGTTCSSFSVTDSHKNSFNLTKITKDGAVDTSFGLDGKLKFIEKIRQIIQDDDGYYYIAAGTFAYKVTPEFSRVLWCSYIGGNVYQSTAIYSLSIINNNPLSTQPLSRRLIMAGGATKYYGGGDMTNKYYCAQSVYCSDGTLETAGGALSDCNVWGNSTSLVGKGYYFMSGTVGGCSCILESKITPDVLYLVLSLSYAEPIGIKKLKTDGRDDTSWVYSKRLLSVYDNQMYIDLHDNITLAYYWCDANGYTSTLAKIERIDSTGKTLMLKEFTFVFDTKTLVVCGQLILVATFGGTIDGVTARLFAFDFDGNVVPEFCSTSSDFSYYPLMLKVAYGSLENDNNPALIIKDLLTNTRYGAGIAEEYLDIDSFAEIAQYCEDEEIFVSFNIKEQKPVMDWIDTICSHFSGFLSMSGGKIRLHCFREQTAAFALTQANLVVENEETPPVTISKRPYSETYNRVEVVYLDRSQNYASSVALAQDEVDQRISGKIRKKTYNMEGVFNSDLAQRLAYRLLAENLYRFSRYSFTVGYSSMLLEVGDVGTLDDGYCVDTKTIRIISISEDVNGRGLNIEAIDDTPYLYRQVTHSIQTGASSGVPETITLAEPTVVFCEDYTNPVLNISLTPANAQVNGWWVYRSYSATGNFELIGRATIDGVSSGLANSIGTSFTYLGAYPACCHRPDEKVQVNIGTLTGLKSVDDGDFFAGRNICKIGNEIIGFKTATDLGGGIWELTGLLRGMYQSRPEVHAVGSLFATLMVDYSYVYPETDIGKTVYFKFLTFYANKVQNISEVDDESHSILGEYMRPARASLVRIKDIVGTDYSGDPTIEWYLGNKAAGFNRGGFNEKLGGVWRYGDSVALLTANDGIGYGNYIADNQLQSVRLQVETSAGVLVKELTLLATAESKALTFAGDMLSTNPANIKIIPMSTLQSTVKNDILVSRT